MIKLRVTWRSFDRMLGTYETVELISIDASVEQTLQGLRKQGALDAEIIGVTYNA